MARGSCILVFPKVLNFQNFLYPPSIRNITSDSVWKCLYTSLISVGTVHYGTGVCIMPHIYVAIYLPNQRSTSDHAMIHIRSCLKVSNNMTDHVIQTSKGKVTLTDEAYWGIVKEHKAKEAEAEQTARTAIIAICQDLHPTLALSDKGNPRIAVKLPKGMFSNKTMLYFLQDSYVFSPEQMRQKCLEEFPQCLNEIKDITLSKDVKVCAKPSK